jgi:Zn-finger nucleic acid-binding protein
MKGSGDFKAEAFNCPNCGAAATPDSHLCAYCGSSIAARICPSCFGNVAVGMKHCPLCGAVVADSTPKEESSLACPICATELSLAAVGQHSLYECPQCGGLWLDKTSFQEICTREEAQEAVLRFRFEEDPKSVNKTEKRKRAYIPCPECGKLMNHKNFSRCSGIVLDWCRDHGSWFDRRELQQIIIFIRNGGLQKARERERINLQVEKERLRMKEYKIAALANRMDTVSGGMQDFEQTGDSILQFLQDKFFD